MSARQKQFSLNCGAAKTRIPIKTACATRLLALLLLCTLLATVQAEDFTYTTNNGAITITGYTGSGGDVTIPDTITGLPVTSIGDFAFNHCTNVTQVTIPNSVTSVGSYAFAYCYGLTTVTMPDSVTSIGDFAFYYCTNVTQVTISTSVTSVASYAFAHCYSLTSVTIPDSVTSIGTSAFHNCYRLTSVTILDSVTNIGHYAFEYCTKLASVTIPNSVTSIGIHAFWACSSLTNAMIGNNVTNIGSAAFAYCTSLTGIYFLGNVPNRSGATFLGDDNAILYYLPGTTNWGPTFDGRPTALWRPQAQTHDASFGVQANQFGFNITWASGMNIAVDACTNLASPTWVPLQTNTLTGDLLYFSDPDWTNHPRRFYRIRWP